MMGHQPPGNRKVAYRALCLGAMLKRNSFEIALQKLDDLPVTDAMRIRAEDKQSAQHDHLRVWIDQEGLGEHFSPQEKNLMDQELGCWSYQALIDTSWRVESLSVLLWALGGLDDVPPYDYRVELETMLKPLEILQPTIDLIWMAQVRDEDDIEEAHHIAQLWHWRASQNGTDKPKDGQHADRADLTSIIHATAQRAYANGQLPPPISGDFPAFGKPYARLDHHEHQTLRSIAYERHFALSWLRGLGDDWDSTPTDI